MFQLKDFVSITASMINRAKATQDKITDFNIGSVARTLMESPAIEIEEFYQRMFAGILEAIPTAIYLGFDFAKVESTYARGVVRVTFLGPIDTAITVPVGTIFTAPASGNKYLTTASVTIPVGATQASLIVECSTAGTSGNVPAGAITAIQTYDLPIGATITSDLITSGSDGESDEERKARFTHFIQTIARGTNGAVEYAARSAQIINASGTVAEYVTRVGFVEVPGTMDVYIYGANQTASAALIAEAQKIIDGYWDEDQQTFVPGYRPVGIRVRVFNMVEQPINAAFTVELLSGLTLTTDIQNDILTRIARVVAAVRADGVLYVETLNNAALGAAGVKAVRTNLTNNISCPSNTVLVMGTVTINEGNV